MSATPIALIFALIVYTAKPPLLVVVLIMLVFIVKANGRLEKSVTTAILSIFVLGLLGRTSQNAIDLSLDAASVLNLILTANTHFITVLAPILVIGDW